MSQAAVSVVIPTYNRGDMIRDAIDSVLGQTVVPSQIIVIDDGSSDDTEARLRSYGGRVLYRRQDNAGPSAARNHGVRLATEPLVAFIDADDAWHPRKLELQLLHMRRDPDLGLLATEQFDWPAAHFPDAPADPAGLVTEVTWEDLVVRTSVLTSSVVVRRDVLAKVGDFDSSLCGPEDRDMFLRIAAVARVAALDVPLTGYRDSPGSLTKHASTCERGMRTILRRLDEKGAWGGRWVLRCKSKSYMHHTCAAAQARARNHTGAVLRELKALAYYPWPYKASETRLKHERAKRLAVNLLRLMRLKQPDPGIPGKPVPERNALDALRGGAAANSAGEANSIAGRSQLLSSVA
jgi:hypothetical protein